MEVQPLSEKPHSFLQPPCSQLIKLDAQDHYHYIITLIIFSFSWMLGLLSVLTNEYGEDGGTLG